MGADWSDPCPARVSKRRELSTLVALPLSGRCTHRILRMPLGPLESVVALRHFQRYMPGPLIINWDRLSAPRAAPVKA
jgi:hypothetical protein